MALLPNQQVGVAGSTVTPIAATAGGDTFAAGPNTHLEVINGGGSAITVTIASPQVCSQGANHDVVVSVPAGATRRFGPFPVARFSNTADGLVHVTYSAVTSVTVAVVTQ